MTTSMNITTQVTGYCDEKCAYSFNYQTSNTCNATNYGTYLELKYIDSGTTPPVSFNLNKYTVGNIELYSPSLHNFNGQPAAGEIIIYHTPISTGSPLYVCIPLFANSNSTNTASQIITDIITQAVEKPLLQGAPSMNIKLNDHTLNSIVPMKPYYFYEETNNYNIIVYGLENAIFISQTKINDLQTIIDVETITKYPTVNYFYLNKDGPSTVSGGSEIYIDCQPTGNSKETEEVPYVKSAAVNDLGSFFKSPIFFYLLSSIVFIILIITIHYLLSRF
jgi:hypothetical protein